jgi:radical SAM protein with 4Fe4S-binding SPASM domain
LHTRLHLEVMDCAPDSGLKRIMIGRGAKYEIARMLNPWQKTDRAHYSNLNDFLGQIKYSPLGIKKLSACQVGYYFASINEKGEVYYCFNQAEEFYMGNLGDKSFREIWRSRRYQLLRDRLSKGNFLEVCRPCLRDRGVNFKVRNFIDPDVRNFNLEESNMGMISK